MTGIERELRALASRDVSDAAARAAEELGRRAGERGLVDIGYTTMDTPIGELVLAASPRGLVMVSCRTAGEALDELARRVSPRVLEAPGRLDDTRRELDEYFAGRRTRFDLRLDWTLARGFTREVLRVTSRIPFGHLTTYSDVASRAGSPRAARAAGNALGSNPLPVVVPCHRVVHRDGGLGGYTGGLWRKEVLLRLEGALQ